MLSSTHSTSPTQTGMYGVSSPEKSIGSAFNAIIKTAGKQPIQCAMAAKRLLTQLHEDEFILYLQPDSIYINEVLVLEMDEGQHMWILPLFIVGVRSIKLDTMTTTAELMSLGYEVNELRLHSEAMEAFRDWIWSDGPGSIEIEISETFMDVMELMDVDSPEELRGFGMQGAQVRASAIDRVKTMKLQEHELTVAALRPEFQTSIDLFAQGMKYRGFEMIDEERKALNQSTTDPHTWLVSEINTLLRTENLQPLYPPFRFAHTILDKLHGTLPASLTSAIIEIHLNHGTYAKQLAELMHKLDLGEKLGHCVSIETAKDHTLIDTLFAHLPAEQTQKMALAMVQRATKQKKSAQRLKEYIKHISPQAWVDTIDETKLSKEDAHTHVQLLLQAGILPVGLAKILDNLDDSIAVNLLDILPDMYLPELDRRLRQLFSGAERSVVEALLPMLLERRLPGIIDIVAQTMLDSKTLGWSRKTIQLACSSIVNHGLAEKYLIDMVRDRNIPIAVREVALETLEQAQNPLMLGQATKFRLMEFFEPPDFRERLRTGRTKTKSNPSLKSAADTQESDE